MKRTKWTVKKITTEALKYNTRTSFANNSRGAQAAAIRLDILNKVCSHMKPLHIMWTDDMLAKEALKYKTRNAFAKGNSKAYAASRHRGTLDDICKHMKAVYNKWTNISMAKEALKYKNKKDFENGSGAYAASCRYGIIDDICSHMELTNTTGKYRWIYAYLFVINGVKIAYVGLSGEPKNRHKTHLNGVYTNQKNGSTHRAKKQSKLHILLNEDHYYEYVILVDPITEKEAGGEEHAWFLYYKERGYLMLDIAKKGALGARYIWTDEKITKEAKKYKTRKAFECGSSGAYQAACKRKILNKICEHMYYVNQTWTDEKITKEAKKYKTRKAFAKGNSKAYAAARHHKILKKVCNHMSSRYIKWTDEMLAGAAAMYCNRNAFKHGNSKAYDTARYRGIMDDICKHMKRKVNQFG